MLHNIASFNTSIRDFFTQIHLNPLAELEFRLGTCKNGLFTVGGVPTFKLRDTLEGQNVVFQHTKYSVLLFDNGLRLRDGKAQSKKQLTRVDLDYVPVAIRMNLAQETDAMIPPDAIPTSTREIERWTAYLPRFCDVELAISLINQHDWEIELEFIKHPLTESEALAPLQYVLSLILPDRPNMVLTSDILTIAAEYNNTWRDHPMVGFLRRVGSKPVNFIETDISQIIKSRYAVSHKLDGAKYVMICTAKSVYAMCEVDAIWLADTASTFTTLYFDGEWDPVEHHLYVFDYMTTTNQDLIKRLATATTVIKRLALANVSMKRVLTSGSAARDTPKTIAWMKKTYHHDWQDRNDGIIYTPIDATYLSGKDRSLRTLKYKFPDKISVDLKLYIVKDTPREKIFRTTARSYNSDVEVRAIRVTASSDDPYFDAINDGTIAEIGLCNSAFYIMRLRPDKTYANFITIVLETLKDMRNPITLDTLLQTLKGKRGGAADSEGLIPALTTARLEQAKVFITQDREFFYPVYEQILEYAVKHNLKLSNPECLANPGAIPPVIRLYTSTGLKSANDLANKLYEQCSPIVFMKTVIPYEEFDISVLNRQVVKFLNYPKVRNISTDKLFTMVGLKIQRFNLENIDPEIELIEIYHRLYMPFPENWELTLKIEESLIATTRDRFSHGGVPDHNDKNQFARTVRTALHAALEFNDLGILIGHWGYYELFPQSDPHNEKVQIISELDPNDIKDKLESILRDVTPLKLTLKTNELNIPHDLHIRRTTFYFDFKGARVPLIDTYNSTTYEMIPYLTFGGKKIRVGNPYVMSRFFMIDRWALMVLKHSKVITDDVCHKKSKVLVDKTLKLRSKTDLVFGEEYAGVYKDFAIERRRVLKQEDKFRPYKPLENFNRFNKLREIY